MSSPAVLVIPDAGPLISLAKAGELRLLRVLGLKISLVDQVFHEATQDKRFDDAVKIGAFVQDNPDLIQIFVTAAGTAAAERRRAGETGRQAGQGEAAIAELLARLDEITGDPDAPVVPLYEDSDIRKRRFILPGNVHLISTKGLLIGMERRRLIPSADAVWLSIRTAGRSPADATVDAPGVTMTGPTKW